MGKYPNAAAGVSKIFTAQILSLVTSILGFFTLVFALMMVGGVEADSQGAAVTGAVGASVLGIAVFVLAIVSFVLGLMGLNKAKADNVNFKYGIYVIIIGIIASAIGSLLPSGSLLQVVCNSLSGVVNLAVMLFVIKAVQELMPGTALAEKGAKIVKIAAAAIIIGICANAFANMSGAMGIVAIVAAVVSLVGYIVYYFMYLSFLAQAKKEL